MRRATMDADAAQALAKSERGACILEPGRLRVKIGRVRQLDWCVIAVNMGLPLPNAGRGTAR